VSGQTSSGNMRAAHLFSFWISLMLFQFSSIIRGTRGSILPSHTGSKGLPSGAGGYGHAQAGDKTAKPPRIYYATRTHSQIAQVLRLMTVHLRFISLRFNKPCRLDVFSGVSL